jgi:hypothetical protein
MKVLFCGGRDFTGGDLVSKAFDRFSVSLAINGGARGADTLAANEAYRRGIQVATYSANWRAHGKAAGHIRNANMLRFGMPDVVVAFPGGKGTADMCAKAKAAGVVVMRPRISSGGEVCFEAEAAG